MFLGPFEEVGDFRDSSISGVNRFLDRLWASVVVACDSPNDGAAAAEPDVMRKLHQTIRKVGDDIPRLSYNTAVAAMMEYFFFQAEDGIRDGTVTGVQTCALPIFAALVGGGGWLVHEDVPGVGARGVGLRVRGVRGARDRGQTACGEQAGDRQCEASGPEIGRASCRERVEISECGG